MPGTPSVAMAVMGRNTEASEVGLIQADNIVFSLGAVHTLPTLLYGVESCSIMKPSA